MHSKTMVFPMILLKLLQWLLYKVLANSCYKAATKVKDQGFFLKNPLNKSSHQTAPPPFPNITKCTLHNRKSQTIVCDIQETLIRSNSTFFPFFMLVAFEGGSIFRAFFLLLSCSFLWVLDSDMKIKVMTFITFCGMRLKDMANVQKAVLPKFYLENLNFNVYQVMASAGYKMVFTRLPRVLVEEFVKDYLSFDMVKGTELHVVGDYYTGLISGSGLILKHKALQEFFNGEKKPHVGVGTLSVDDQLFISLCKEAYVIENEGDTDSVMPREKYPKPLIFHDGRLAFLPTPTATLTMFMWLPIGLFLSIFRLIVGILLPYKIAIILGCGSGIIIKVKGVVPNSSKVEKNNKKVLYVCSHRTLLDPVFLSTSLGKPLTAVTYSLSKMSEILAPIKTVRLTRDRKKDGETMEKLLREGDLVVCPEGTTCREPYLLRFSSLFAELADEIVPVAMNTKVTMFYGTTASGLKCLDPIFFLMNPKPCYEIQILEKVDKEYTVGAGGKSSYEVANYIQHKIANALGFQCTTLTRKDKYLMLAGNEGVVPSSTN